jgi:DNA-binding transcriptional ArsR family regulator
MTYEDAITALADPTRRTLVERLRAGPMAVQALAQDLPISRPAVSQHLKILSDAGLLLVQARGTRRLYRLAPAGLADLRAYLDGLWTDALAGVETRGHQIATQVNTGQEKDDEGDF